MTLLGTTQPMPKKTSLSHSPTRLCPPRPPPPGDFASGKLGPGDRLGRPRATNCCFESCTAEIGDPNTRKTYLEATGEFRSRVERRHLRLDQLTPIVVGAYIEEVSKVRSASTVNQHLAAIRMLFDYLVLGQVLPFNPAVTV